MILKTRYQNGQKDTCPMLEGFFWPKQYATYTCRINQTNPITMVGCMGKPPHETGIPPPPPPPTPALTSNPPPPPLSRPIAMVG